MTEDVVGYEKRGAVAVITLQRPPVNALGYPLRQGLMDRLEEAMADDAVKAVVLVGKGRGFSGGADITEFGKPRQPPHLREVADVAELGSKPVVAAIHGMALGGGFELPLGCHYRIATATAVVGQPEVKLGIIPGAGATQRLPRLIGIELALEVIVAGDPVPAAKALELGMIDAIVDGDDLTSEAVAYAEGLLKDGKGPRVTRNLSDKIGSAEEAAAAVERSRQMITKKFRGMRAAEACLEAVEASATLSFEDGMAKEAELFQGCVMSDQSAAQRHAFFAEREVAKIPDVPADTQAQPIKTAAVLGAGTMGGGIAMNFANAGIPVTVLETSKEALDKGLDVVRGNYAGSVSRGRINQAKMDAAVGLITGTLDYGDVKDADIVIEAVFESMDIKKEVFAKLDAVCKPDTILATNTSTLDVNEIASATNRPDKVVGTHFFSPANVMRLLENVRGDASSAETIQTVMQLSKRIKKVGVLVGVCYGFVGNRMLHAYTREANFLLEEGALPQQIDKVIYDFGLPMGPFAMGDLAGLDVGWRIRQERAKTHPSNDRYAWTISDRLCERGRFGQKTQSGWYTYAEGSRTPQTDPEVEALIVEVSKEQGIERRDISDQEILERCMYPLINEGAKILEEGIALRPVDIDIVWIYGYGFPVYRGGPMFYADLIGTKAVYDVMQRLHEEHGELLRPAPLLENLAKDGKGFHDK
jgi:3-hydroxyacyl-CoA dehydrogenase